MTNALPTFLNGFAMSAALIMAIGAQNLFVLRQGLKREHVGPIVLFCGGADAMLIAAGVGGVGALLGVMPQLVILLSIGGALFLGCYGLRAFQRMMAPEAMTVAAQGGTTLSQAIGATAAFTFLNPHVYLDTVLLMGAAGSAQPAALRPIFVLGAASASIGWFAALGYGARLLTPLFARPTAWRVLDAVVGIVMLTLAASLIARAFQ
ncbi:MAG: amino acid transporter [Leeuwenhoekiella sp.]|nr:MAG: amino acid transporter [Leeuwenhoekiella sp.]